MILARYVVEVDSTQALKLSAEQLELATQIDNGPTKLLIFRDRFVAYKVATHSGGTFWQGRVVDAGTASDAVKGGFVLGNRTLMLEHSVAQPTIAEA